MRTDVYSFGMTYALCFIDQLIQQKVTQFCVAPGSRSAPLAIGAHQHPSASTIVHFDERGLTFYALGWSQANQHPAAVITTSGTAVANLLPACMEAFHSKTPLILLTADRPHGLRQCGANQTTDHLQMFKGLVKWQMDLTCSLSEKEVRSIAAQAVFQSLEGTPGPVHINCPFAEPLYQDLPLSLGHPISFSFSQKQSPPLQMQKEKGIILIGALPPGSDPTPILELGKKLRWPIFADILSQARRFPTKEQIRHFDWLIRSSCPEPDCILHFGGAFISKHLLQWNTKAPRVHIHPFSDLQDPMRSLTMRIQADISSFCATFCNPPADPSWLNHWQMLDHSLRARIDAHFLSPFTEAHLIRSLPSHLPLYFGNSMPIRYADHFFFPEKCPPLFANRGVSGIDGNIATIAGLSDGLKSPMIALIGDQTALHDLNSFSLLKNREILLIISNNGGGGIFDHLPSQKSPFLDTAFANAHSFSFEKGAEMFHLPYLRTDHLPNSLPSCGILEITTERKQSASFLNTL